jgi:hypothetical protein
MIPHPPTRSRRGFLKAGLAVAGAGALLAWVVEASAAQAPQPATIPPPSEQVRLAHQPEGGQSDFGPSIGEFTHSSERKTMADTRPADGTVVQVDVGALLDARPVTTLTAGKLVTWTMGIDGGGKGSGYLTMAAAHAVGDKNPKALPDTPLIPASGSRPDMLLHYSNDDGKGNQARVVGNGELLIPVPKTRDRKSTRLNSSHVVR